jgi:hypothetical protein
MKTLHTNKRLVAITPNERYHQLLIDSKEHPGCTLEFTLQNTGYYLIDNPHEWSENEEFTKVFRRAFESELAESSIPKEHWPATDDFIEFQKYFNYRIHPLIGDLGSKQIITGES